MANNHSQPYVAHPEPVEKSCLIELDQLVSLHNPRSGDDIAAEARKSRLHGVVIGNLQGWDGSGRPLVDFPGNPQAQPLPARTTVAVDPDPCGCEVALMFECGDPWRPILVGVMQGPTGKPGAVDGTAVAQRPLVHAQIDEERIILTAEKEIVLRCGQASITLTRAGKVLIRGAYLLSRSSGMNRIKGASVQIN
jgi:hypothetical protein